MAGILDRKVAISLNGKKLKVDDFKAYVELYDLSQEAKYPKIHEVVNGRWQVVVSVSENQFIQASFVNAVCTSRGGTHVNLVVDQIASSISEAIKKKNKNLNVKPFQIKNNLAVFINCLIENPSFDSQTKETLVLKPEHFGSVCELSEKFLKDVAKSGVIDFIVSQANAKERVKIQKALSGRKSNKLLGIPKLEDANLAGTKESHQCLLILTEGDSAKALAMSGIDVVGRDKYGVFPLRGKLLNVREANPSSLKNNAEIQSIVKILGLQFDRVYEDVDSLRYGGILIMADQDHDGSHIKGLIINFIHFFWPSLIRLNKFMKEFVTPVIKCSKPGEETLSFYTVQDYHRWLSDRHHDLGGYRVKYYKGLGTSTNQEAREYFKQLSKHVISFKFTNSEDDSLIDLAFARSKADERKKWIEASRLDQNVDHAIKHLTYADFINKELVQYSVASNARAIPCLVDGLKPGQRKILFACFKRNLKAEIKVAQLAGYVAEHSAYHHGEMSLSATIVNMAQDFIGANNVNLLEPIGQFGSRNLGGKDSASARYIFTRLSPLARVLFHELDDKVVSYLEDDGIKVEPEFYVPILPLVLVNGAEGIGTGWSTTIPPFNPLDLCRNIRNLLEDKPLEDLTPWFYGFTGTVHSEDSGAYRVAGSYKILSDDTLEITELPINTWISDYKEFLESMMQGDKSSQKLLELREHHSRSTVHFVLKFRPGCLADFRSDIEKKLRLSSLLSLRNIVLFDAEGKLRRYDNIKPIQLEFYKVRLEFYQKRKDFVMAQLTAELRVLENKVRFVNAILTGELDINNKRKSEVEAALRDKGFDGLASIENELDQDAA